MAESLSLKKIEHKIVQLKIYAFFAYGTSVFYFLFVLIWFYINGITIAEIFLYYVFVVVITLIFNNFWSKVSDRIKNRIFFMIMVKFLSIAAVLVVIFEVSFITVMLFAFLLYFINNETYLTAFFYELLEARERLRKAENANYKENKAKEYTKYRIMGSIGWACGGPICGLIIELVNFNTKSRFIGFQFAFFLSILLNIFILIYLFIITRGLESKLNNFREATSKSISVDKNKKSFYYNYEFIFLLIVMFIFEISSSMISNIKTIYATELGGNYIFVGFLAFVWAWCEVPLFFISSNLVEKYSYKVPVLISGLFLIVKYLFYIYIITPETLVLFLILEALNTFGILWPAITYAINDLFAQEHKALGTSVYLTSMAAARFLGNLLGMFLAIIFNIGGYYESYRILFVSALIITFIGILCFILFNFITAKVNRSKKIT